MNKITSFLKKAFWFGAAVIIVSCAGITYFSTSTVSADVPLAPVVDLSPVKMEALKNTVVDEISNCEVTGYKTGDAPIILDTNNRMSIGPMMFQVATVIQYEKALYGKDVTRLEATTIALDEVQAKALAKDILFKVSDGQHNWLNCSNKHDITAQINLIKSVK